MTRNLSQVLVTVLLLGVTAMILGSRGIGQALAMSGCRSESAFSGGVDTLPVRNALPREGDTIPGWGLGALWSDTMLSSFPTCDTVHSFARETHYGQAIEWEGNAFLCYFMPVCTKALRFYLCNDEFTEPLRNFSSLKGLVERSGQARLRFAMNAGMYTEDRDPVGLYVEEGELLSHVDRRKGEFGNFYMQPNGILVVDTLSRISILRTEVYRDQEAGRLRYATQSGPMLVIDDEINSQFRPESKSRFVRNGVGITDHGQVVFVISREPVNFHTFASFFKERLCCPQALYLDGAISRVHLPELGQHFLGGDFGPMIAVVDEEGR